MITNMVKHAFGTVIACEEYDYITTKKGADIKDIMKNKQFKKELVWFMANQLIRAQMEHYNVVLGVEYTL